MHRKIFHTLLSGVIFFTTTILPVHASGDQSPTFKLNLPNSSSVNTRETKFEIGGIDAQSYSIAIGPSQASPGFRWIDSLTDKQFNISNWPLNQDVYMRVFAYHTPGRTPFVEDFLISDANLSGAVKPVGYSRGRVTLNILPKEETAPKPVPIEEPEINPDTNEEPEDTQDNGSFTGDFQLLEPTTSTVNNDELFLKWRAPLSTPYFEVAIADSYPADGANGLLGWYELSSNRPTAKFSTKDYSTYREWTLNIGKLNSTDNKVSFRFFPQYKPGLDFEVQLQSYSGPIAEEPATEEPSTDNPTTQEPVTEGPSTEDPTTQEPTSEPTPQEPVDTPTDLPTDYISDPAGDLLVWANEGGDKVTRDELRAAKNDASVYNSVWNGNKLKLFGAKNEVINFNLVLEAPNKKLSDIEVDFRSLYGPNDSQITTTGSNLFDWTNRNIELFYVRYLEIKGLSAFMGHNYDQRHLPAKMRTPHDASGNAQGGWNDRPNHNKFYPDIAVPLELEQGFDIQQGQNQSIWGDIYIPKDKAAGTYYGEISVREGGTLTTKIPVEMQVYDFTLPDTPSAKTMLFMGSGDINKRYLGQSWPSDSASQSKSEQIRDQHFKMAHRHKISLIDNDSSGDKPSDQWIKRLSGDLFTPKYGYSGPGVATGNNVYSIGTYGGWSWKNEGEAGMRKHTDNWEAWFQNNFPNVERFLYLIDESSDYAQIEKWAKWIEENPGPGKNLLSMATTWVSGARNQMPSLDVPTSGMYVADTNSTQSAVDHYKNRADKRIFFYNGGRPGQGSFMTEDDGVALRELAWGQYKKDIDRWFYWESTYYNNFQGGTGETDVFNSAHTFGGKGSYSNMNGETGWNYSNGDGLLFYPGTDKVYGNESYGLNGPIASLRLKFWRRGIQDVDYLTLAAKKDPAAVQQIINKIVPKVLWEYGVADMGDPTWVRSAISWSDDPDVWEQARRDLAEIIAG